MTCPLITTKIALRSALSEIENELQRYSTENDGNEPNARIYTHFCRIAELLGPAISGHLRTVCAADLAQEAAEAAEQHMESPVEPNDHWRFDTPFPIRQYNADALARLVYDLKPAIGAAFPHQQNNVDLIVRDLIYDNPPVALMPKPPLPPSPRNPKRPADAGGAGRHHKDLRELARKTIYEVVVFEAARRSADGNRVGQRTLCRDLTHGAFTDHDWKRLAAEERKSEARLVEQGRSSPTEHPKLPLVNARLAIRAKDRVTSKQVVPSKRRDQ